MGDQVDFTDVPGAWGDTLASNIDPANPGSVQNQLAQGLDESGYIVSISEEEKNAVGESFSSLGDALSGKNIDSNTSFRDFAGTTGTVATDVARQALQQLKDSLLAKRRVKIKSLINSVGACVTQTPQEFVDNLSTKFNEFTRSLPETLTQLTLQFGSAVASDPRFQESFADLEAVQYLSGVINEAYGLYNSVMTIVRKFEPYFPIIEIVVSAASIWATGGTSAAAFTSQSAQLAAQELKKAIPLIVTPLKNLLYNTEVEVPAFILGAIDFASSADAKTRFARNLEKAERWAMIDDASFEEVNRGLKFPSRFASITAQIGTSPTTSAFVRNILKKVTPSNLTYELFRPVDLTDVSSRRTARPSSGSNGLGFVSFTDQDIKKISGKIIDSKDTTASFYADRQMFKLVIEQLKEDGCIIDLDAQAYDEYRTFILGEGDRAAFKRINDRITAYHEILALVLGEVRANITEEIPVIDFYRKSETSLTSRYTDDTHFNSTIAITDRPRDGAGAYMITASDILGSNPPIFNINLAVSSYQVAEFFYTSASRIAEEKNLIVEYNTQPKPTAPGILNGLFSIPKTRDNYGNIIEWQWIDERATMPGVTDNLPLGTKYTPYHIWDGQVDLENRKIVARPLFTSTPGFDGLASEYFADITTFIQTEIVSRFSIPANLWQTLGGKIDTVTLKSYAKNAAVQRRMYSSSRASNKALGWFRAIHKTITSIKFWGTKPQPTPSPVLSSLVRGGHVKLVQEKSRYPEKLKNLVLDPATWMSKVQNIGGKTWVVLNATTAAADESILVYQGKRYTTDLEARALQEMLGHPKAVYAATVKDWTSSSIRKTLIANITVISPFELLKNNLKHSDGVTTTILYDSGDGTKLSSDLWLVSTKNLGFSLADNGRLALCILHSNTKALVFQVTQISYFDTAAITAGNYRVITDSYTYEYENGVSPLEEKPKITIVGPACWLYKLSPVQVSDPSIRDSFYPLRYPSDFFAISNPATGSFKKDNIEDLYGMTITVSLPELAPGKSYADYSKYGVSLGVMSNLLNKTAISNFIKGKLQNRPIIDVVGANDIPLSKMKDLVTPWLKAEDTLRWFAKSSIPELANLVKQLPVMKQIADTVDAIINGKELITAEKCAVIDSLLGNNSTPWFSIGNGPSDTVSEETLSVLVTTIKEALEGKATNGAGVPLRYLPGDNNVIGRPDSLYFQRYLFLNNRLNRSEGPLAKAEMLLYNWNLLKKSNIFKSQQLYAYAPYLDALPVASMDDLIYLPPEEGSTSGAFYIKEIVDAVRGQIHDKCLLICAPCPVRNDCPFFDEASVLRKYMPTAEHLNLWFKDNELDLLVYEIDEVTGEPYLNLSCGTSRISAAAMKDRHKLYTEIIRDPEKELDLDSVREEIAKRVPGFYLDKDRYVDNLDWLTGGRYGSLKLASSKGEVSNDPRKHSYLYNALFIRDEETYFKYAPTPNAYNVSLNVIEGNTPKTYTGSVRIKEPVELILFDGISGESEVYLISDDTKDANGIPINPFIYLGLLKDLIYDFDFDRSDTSITDPDDPRKWPTAADIAQWCVNEYKWMDPTPDQYWMQNIQKLSRADRTTGSKVINLPGRPRIGDVVDPLISEPPAVEDIVRGKPMIKNYINFVRRLRIRLDSIQWAKSGKPEDIETAKRTLIAMKTKLRLAVLKK